MQRQEHFTELGLGESVVFQVARRGEREGTLKTEGILRAHSQSCYSHSKTQTPNSLSHLPSRRGVWALWLKKPTEYNRSETEQFQAQASPFCLSERSFLEPTWHWVKNEGDPVERPWMRAPTAWPMCESSRNRSSHEPSGSCRDLRWAFPAEPCPNCGFLTHVKDGCCWKPSSFAMGLFCRDANPEHGESWQNVFIGWWLLWSWNKQKIQSREWQERPLRCSTWKKMRTFCRMEHMSARPWRQSGKWQFQTISAAVLSVKRIFYDHISSIVTNKTY